MNKNEEQVLAAVAAIAVMACLAQVIADRYYYVVDQGGFFLMSVCLGVPLALMSFQRMLPGKGSDLPESLRKWAVMAYFILLPALIFAAGKLANGLFDFGETQHYRVRVLGEKISDDGRSNASSGNIFPWFRRLYVESWDGRDEFVRIPISRSLRDVPKNTILKIAVKNGLLGAEWIRSCEIGDPGRSRKVQAYASPSSLSEVDLDQNVRMIPLRPLMDLDGMSRDSIFNLRQEGVRQMPLLAPPNYQPSRAVFGDIQDGKPWWGTLGLSYFGDGEKSIEGPSRESQFVANPYLLVGVATAIAYRVTDRSLAPKSIHPLPRQLKWEQGGAWGHVVYDMQEFFRDAVRYRYDTGSYHNKGMKDLALVTYNARDLGFNYLAISSTLSRNISGTTDKVIPNIQVLHTGQSCGYPGGCNNRSPEQNEAVVRWGELPGRIYLRLWKEKPSDAFRKSDMDFIIDLD